ARFIRKPVEPDEFIKIIQDVIRDVKKGGIMPGKPPVKEEKEVLKLYSERLVNKLEEKMLKLEEAIAERERAEEVLRQSEEKYRGFFEASKDVVYITSAEGKFIDMNDSGLELFGIKRDALDKINIAGDLYADLVDMTAFTKIINRAGYVAAHETNLKKMDGMVFPATITATAIKDSEGKITGYQGIIRDETNRKRAEEKIKRSLKEKESLLAEIHHRVKNNMQIISSLLSLQSKDIEDERALSLIKNCEDRIMAMSLVHEKLYLSGDLSKIDLGDYITNMATYLFQVHRVNSSVVNFSSYITDVPFSIETAIPLGLIINELISNALKHAFPGGRKGNIAVELTQDTKADEYTLTVTDDGIGFPEGIDYRNPETFGLQLANMLAEQLHGTMELDKSKGTSFRWMKPETRNWKLETGRRRDFHRRSFTFQASSVGSPCPTEKSCPQATHGKKQPVPFCNFCKFWRVTQ
ncbi:MAG: PAS domain S-box protein, partial [Deltaproteobacteria bacterium]|nr:PAS domain S-box protein [Deltaproteobacteria bacterium]